MGNKYSNLNKQEYNDKYNEEIIYGDTIEIRCTGCDLCHRQSNRYFRGYLVVPDYNLIGASCSSCEKRGAEFQLTTSFGRASNVAWKTESSIKRIIKQELATF